MLKPIGHLLGFILASAVSPTPYLFVWIMKPYIDVMGIVHQPDSAFGEILRFETNLQAHPEQNAVLTLMLIVMLVISSLYMVLVGSLSSRLLAYVAHNHAAWREQAVTALRSSWAYYLDYRTSASL